MQCVNPILGTVSKTITQWFLECFPEEFPLTSHFPEEYNTVYILPTALSLPHPNVLLWMLSLHFHTIQKNDVELKISHYLQNYLNESLKCLEKTNSGGGGGGGGNGGNVSPDHLLLHHLDSKAGLETKLLINSHLTSLEKK